MRVWALLPVPIVCPLKVNAVGVTLSETGACPVPVRITVCGEPGALLAISRFAVRVPAAVGVKVTLRLQLAPAARLVVQLLPPIE